MELERTGTAAIAAPTAAASALGGTSASIVPTAPSGRDESMAFTSGQESRWAGHQSVPARRATVRQLLHDDQSAGCRSSAGSHRSDDLPTVVREGHAEILSDLSKDASVGDRVIHQEHDDVDPGVPLLQGDPTLERLEIGEPRL